MIKYIHFSTVTIINSLGIEYITCQNAPSLRCKVQCCFDTLDQWLMSYKHNNECRLVENEASEQSWRVVFNHQSKGLWEIPSPPWGTALQKSRFSEQILPSPLFSLYILSPLDYWIGLLVAVYVVVFERFTTVVSPGPRKIRLLTTPKG